MSLSCISARQLGFMCTVLIFFAIVVMWPCMCEGRGRGRNGHRFTLLPNPMKVGLTRWKDDENDQNGESTFMGHPIDSSPSATYSTNRHHSELDLIHLKPSTSACFTSPVDGTRLLRYLYDKRNPHGFFMRITGEGPPQHIHSPHQVHELLRKLDEVVTKLPMGFVLAVSGRRVPFCRYGSKTMYESFIFLGEGACAHHDEESIAILADIGYVPYIDPMHGTRTPHGAPSSHWRDFIDDHATFCYKSSEP